MLKNHHIENIFAYLDFSGADLGNLCFLKANKKSFPKLHKLSNKIHTFFTRYNLFNFTKNIQQIFFTKKQTLASASMQEQQQMVLNNE